MKKYKLPDRYELIISDYCNLKSSSGRFQIKDLKKNVASRKFYEKSLSKLDIIISEYEDNLKLLDNIDIIAIDPDIDIILKPGSYYHLFYKGIDLGLFKTIVEVIKIVTRANSFESKINALNNHEEVSL